MFGDFGPGELLLIFVIVILLFGAKRLPEIGSSLGKGIREFKSSLSGVQNEIKNVQDPPRRQVPPAEAQRSSTEDEGEPRNPSDGAA